MSSLGSGFGAETDGAPRSGPALPTDEQLGSQMTSSS